MFSQNAFIDSFGLTDKGKVRPVNQDQYFIGSIHKAMDIERSSLPDSESDQLHGGTMAQLLLVADGVGGAAAGDQASGLAITTFADYVTDSMSCFCHRDIQHLGQLKNLGSGRRRSDTGANENRRPFGPDQLLSGIYYQPAVKIPRLDPVRPGWE